MKLPLMLLLIAASAPAVNLAHAADAANAPASKLMAEIQGVYKHSFKNGLITPGKAPGEADQVYESEDIVEIVPYDASHIYVRAELQFYNGHQCSISGMAGYENGSFVYHNSETPPEGYLSCTLKVSQNGKNLVLTDRATPDAESSCRGFCGVRGSLSDYKIASSSKRKIRYLDRLKASREYVRAEEELKTTSAKPAE